MSQIRVLVVPGRISGGVGTVVMNLFRNIDKQRIHYDFCVPEGEPCSFSDEIIKGGSEIFNVPKIQKVGPIKYIQTLRSIIRRNGPYDVIHIHSVHMGALALLASRIEGIKKRIYHVHNTQDAALEGKQFKNVIEFVMNTIIDRNANVKLACGIEAGKYIYGKRKFTVINNAIDINRFKPYSKEEKMTIRRELKIPDNALVIGNVARFNIEKNQRFILRMAEADKISNNRCLFILVGDGQLRAQIEKMVNEKSLDDKIIFLGNRQDVERIYNAMDIFCLPSLFEGLPVTALEAQACGIPCLLSDTITNEADLGVSAYKQLALEDNPDKWVQMIYTLEMMRNDDQDSIKSTIVNKGYEISSISEKMLEIYSS